MTPGPSFITVTVPAENALGTMERHLGNKPECRGPGREHHDVQGTTMLQHYCQNELTITGPAGDIAAFSSSVEGTDELLSFQRLIHEPELGLLRGSKGWLQWRVTHWGCKWDAIDVERSQSSRTEIVYNYDTGFGAGVNPIREASRLWPELTFQLSYASPGSCFAGAVTFKNGLTVEERIGRYSDICADDPTGTEPGPVYLASLSVVCRRLPLSDRGDAIAEFRRTLLESGPGGIEDIETLLLRLGDPASTLAYCAHPETTVDHIWEILTRSMGDLHGCGLLLTLRAGGSPHVKVVATVLSHLQAAFIERSDPDDDRPGAVDREGIARLRAVLEAAEHKGDLEGFSDTLRGLSSNWENSCLEEFLDAAWRLHF